MAKRRLSQTAFAAGDYIYLSCCRCEPARKGAENNYAHKDFPNRANPGHIVDDRMDHCGLSVYGPQPKMGVVHGMGHVCWCAVVACSADLHPTAHVEMAICLLCVSSHPGITVYYVLVCRGDHQGRTINSN